MNDPLPPLPEPVPQPPPFDPAQLPPPPSDPETPSIWPKFWLGVLLNLVSVGICFACMNPLPFCLAGLIAFVLLFFSRYRLIFIGFLTTIGVVLLVSLIACGAIVAMSH